MEGTTAYLNWKEFIVALGVLHPDKLSKIRENALRIAYDSNSCHGLLELTQYGPFEKHPLAQRGIMSADELRCEFHCGLSKIQADANSAVTWESFKVAQKYMISLPDDDDSIAMLLGVWHATALQKTPTIPIFGGKKAAFIEKLEQRTHKEENTRDVLLRAFQKQDMSKTGFVTQAEFSKICQVLGLVLSDIEIKR
ncbi:hypothetical protein THRCLA_11173 [Thraustotheca clavata]|uniref:EF-hand domain-containing protein n=1 Tax=Thraustotheca clavata TaxID=74557 RepID=A0A1V9Y8L3_9STRA|nr:hypothetical protein THRCLA_11173 [Thraustotheca clavata]